MTSAEFGYLDAQDIPSGQVVVHCENCIHGLRSYRRHQLLALALALAGLIIALFGVTSGYREATIAGTGLTLVSIGAAMVTGRLHRRNFSNRRPPFPLLGEILSVEATEFVRGSIQLDPEGHYAARADKASGIVAIKLRFLGKDRHRLDAFRKKFGIRSGKNIPLHAGFLVFANKPSLSTDEYESGRANTLALQDEVGRHPFLTTQDGRRDQDTTIERQYVPVQQNTPNSILPIQIVPTLPAEAGHRTLELDIQISPDADRLSEGGSAYIESLVLRGSQRLNRVTEMDPPGKHQSSGDEMQTIIWEDLIVQLKPDQHDLGVFRVRFGSEIEPDSLLAGHLRIALDNLASGLNEIVIHYPWGDRREIYRVSNTNPDSAAAMEGDHLKVRTMIDIEFEFHLDNLLFQELFTQTGHQIRRGLSPNYEIIAALTAGINEHSNSTYIRHVVENPPSISKSGANVTKRFWDIAGRYYERGYVFPIDFHLAITGREAYGPVDDSQIQVDITTRAIATADMHDHVTNLRDVLSEIVSEQLDRILVVTSPERSQSARPQSNTQVTRILELLRKLDEALIDGRISESRYEELLRRYQSQLSELGYG